MEPWKQANSRACDCAHTRTYLSGGKPIRLFTPPEPETSLGPQGSEDPTLFTNVTMMTEAVGDLEDPLPERPPGSGLKPFSKVLNAPLHCASNTPIEFHSLKVCS